MKKVIEENIELLREFKIYNPRYNYYNNKISLDLRIAFDSRKITLSEFNDLEVSREELSVGKGFNVNKVMNKFKQFYDKGLNILSVLELEEILDCRSFCEETLRVCTTSFIEKAVNNKTLILAMEKSFNTLLSIKDNETGNEIYGTIEDLERLMYHGLFYKNSRTKVMEIYDRVFSIKLDLLEKDKKFYYLPPEETFSMKNSNSFSKDSISDENNINYYNYHKEKYSIILSRKLYENPLDFLEAYNFTMSKVKNSGLVEDIKFRLDGDLMRHKDRFVSYDPIEIISNIFNPRLSRILTYDRLVFNEAVKLSKEFVDSFSKSSLVRYYIDYARISSMSKNTVNINNLNHDSCLLSGLNNLKNNNIINNAELEVVFNHYRRENKDE